MIVRLPFALLVCCAALAAEAGARPLNIVFILSDNQSATALASYGNRDVRTPHIDRLARQGVRFTRAYAASGMCSSTRATLLTGLMPSQHGLHNALFDPWVDSLGPGWNAVAEYRSVPLTLANRGYQTAMIGKWHLGDTRQASLGFQHWVALPYGHTMDFWDNELVEKGSRHPVRDRHIVDVLAEKAVEYLGRVEIDRPFYLQLNLDGPYALPPSNYGPARNRHYARYAAQTFHSMPQEPVSDDILVQLNGPYVPGVGLEVRDLDAVWDSLRYGTIRMQGDRESYANFLSQNSVVDDAVGRVVAALERRGLMKNTVVIYSADQGNLFGQHGTWGHTIWFTPSHLHEEAVNIPLIVVHPDAGAGVTSKRMVGQYDFAPSLLDIAGVRDVELADSPGRSFAGALREAASEGEGPQAVFFEQEESRGLRTARHAYWKRLEGTGEPVLFDMSTDPGQRHDLYPEMRDSELVRGLDATLEQFFARYSDPAYDLWKGGVAKGTTPKPVMWLRRNPWPWAKKYWRDWVTHSPSPEPFSEAPL
ncbi:MAG: sulfatase-like hydrolase/transferase [Deltaproteobacteria bacterium]|nr:sulfatase-like hydrolase/transferase [Deltaproteobacteria bacterium]MBW2417595.1 sulfatase-like hydrolase/transferase [Deltaproteobacteria bacterium]